MRRRLARFEVAEASMVPTLWPGDYLVAVARRHVPRRGSIVVFQHPRRTGFHLVKRVVGLPGEEVVVRGGQVFLGDVRLVEPWATGPTEPQGTWPLGDDEVFVLGDLRELSSDDGRTLGPLPLAAVPWRVWFRYWPPRRAGTLGGGAQP